MPCLRSRPCSLGGHTCCSTSRLGAIPVLGAIATTRRRAFDKVFEAARPPLPGGRYVEKLARDGDSKRFTSRDDAAQERALPGDEDYYAFSFSGVKTAVLNAVRASKDIEADKSHIARAFQDSLIDTLVEKTARAANAFARQRVVLGGGVACNRTLADAMRTRLESEGISVFTPSPRLATDNAAMISRAAFFRAIRASAPG